MLFKKGPPFKQENSKLKLRLKTDLQAVAEVLDAFEAFAYSLLPEPIYWECQTVLIEGFTNAVRHAHHGLPEKMPIDIEVKFCQPFIEMRIWDWGQPFDFQAKLRQVLATEENLTQSGGRGLRWMYRLTDELQYIRTKKEQNCLILRKRFM